MLEVSENEFLSLDGVVQAYGDPTCRDRLDAYHAAEIISDELGEEM